jgi:hypothetical protein
MTPPDCHPTRFLIHVLVPLHPTDHINKVAVLGGDGMSKPAGQSISHLSSLSMQYMSWSTLQR